ncbi:hypothetical protein GPECTOR_256g646 [Gonium pectorale]|uniref:Uncharacterized protein n=1 Tax=Gonium pectorale TaxID=33097 RepID=A0A150FW85_GONPE|nr:hypothetical protein GPECTOR_256g646 [Gonium pectorale]|eukprot:KXZ41871.1 hypothetical protein GPECTOR_256g646 [Gonium pectorale]
MRLPREEVLRLVRQLLLREGIRTLADVERAQLLKPESVDELLARAKASPKYQDGSFYKMVLDSIEQQLADHRDGTRTLFKVVDGELCKEMQLVEPLTPEELARLGGRPACVARAAAHGWAPCEVTCTTAGPDGAAVNMVLNDGAHRSWHDTATPTLIRLSGLVQSYVLGELPHVSPAGRLSVSVRSADNVTVLEHAALRDVGPDAKAEASLPNIGVAVAFGACWAHFSAATPGPGLE